MTQSKIQTKRFYKMDKALQLVEGTNVAALWAHLIDGYNYFVEKEKVETENTLFQSAKAIQAFTGIGVKAQATARKRLEELGFLKHKVAAIPGHATKSTFYILYPDAYEKWCQQHDYDKLRDEKYHELQDSTEHDKLDQWIKDNTKDTHKQALKRMNQKQSAVGTFANPTEGHLQTSPGDICNTPKDTVIETIEIETVQVDNTQTNGKGCVYAGEPYIYLKGQTKEQLLDLVIDVYKEAIIEYHPDDFSKSSFDDDRFIGSLDIIEKEFSKLQIEAAANCYIGILGYLDDMVEQLTENPTKFRAAHKLENLLKFNRKVIFSRENKKRGELIYEADHRAKRPERSL